MRDHLWGFIVHLKHLCHNPTLSAVSENHIFEKERVYYTFKGEAAISYDANFFNVPIKSVIF